MAHEKILVVDDEEDIRELVRYNLERNGYEVSCVSSGEEALDVIRSYRPELVVLDLMLPGIDGFEVCRTIKSDPKTEHLPIIMLTAKGEESDVVTGLELGAEDYIVKPFSPQVLLARVRAVLRRIAREPVEEGSVIQIADLVVHPGKREVLVKGKPVDLTSTEFRILHYLARRPGWVFTRQQIIDAARGDDYPVTDRSVDVHIVSLRKKMGALGEYVETVRGVGYRFREI
ncbi:MAG TPA: response regulator transcription factor [Candidatus Eisenbacteria bacterium]|uniref:Response regulator transcription factor n=1 Tax=Eiseniibacteriota bacterium TaxID=2212470 RepID=A0A7V2AVG6_UNCEI|nr:response regulator transcription factor [Candidatus Eisenbacteria bacterium]